MSTCFMLASRMIRTVRLRVTRDTTKPQMLRKVLFDTGGNHLNSHQERVFYFIFLAHIICVASAILLFVYNHGMSNTS